MMIRNRLETKMVANESIHVKHYHSVIIFHPKLKAYDVNVTRKLKTQRYINKLFIL
jgi:hypothetical protein